MKPEVSIIIVTYNSENEIVDCLKSVNDHVKSSYEILVVDNASGDKTLKRIKDEGLRMKNLKLIENNENVGFGRGCNVGLKRAEGDYFLLLNPDTRLEEDAIGPQLTYLKNHPDVGIVGIKMVDQNGKVVMPGPGGHFPTLGRVMAWMLLMDDIPIFNRLLKSYHPRPFYFRKTKEIDWVTGAFFLFKKEVYQKIGGFDPNLFLYFEEVEYCYRAKRTGFKIVFNPQTQIVHIGHASSKDSKKTPTLGEYKGMIYFYQKYFPQMVPQVKMLLRLGAVIRMLIFGLLGRKQSYVNYKEAYATV